LVPDLQLPHITTDGKDEGHDQASQQKKKSINERQAVEHEPECICTKTWPSVTRQLSKNM
jgi:hypothetical protein